MNIAIVIILVLVSVYFDLRFMKIPNKVTMPSILFGLAYWIATDKLFGLRLSFTGLLSGLLVFLIPYILGGIGAGDVKLMMAIGSLLGWKLTVLAAILTAIVGGLIALGYIIITKGGSNTRTGLYKIIVIPLLKVGYRITGYKNFLVWQTRHKANQSVNSKKYIPYAVPIAIGTLLAISGLFKGIINF